MIAGISGSRVPPMTSRILTGLLLLAGAAGASAQAPVTLKSAVVVLSDDPQLRQEVEDALVIKAREHAYDAVASHAIVADIADADSRAFMNTLGKSGIQAVLMLRPSAVGEGSSLESVRAEVSPETFERMREFAGEVSTAGTDDLIAVVHLGVYALDEGTASLLSSGAVWLDEEVATREEGVERLLDLVVTNIDGIRPAIRRHLGLPPLAE
jgi:hypothetical protein